MKPSSMALCALLVATRVAFCVAAESVENVPVARDQVLTKLNAAVESAMDAERRKGSGADVAALSVDPALAIELTETVKSSVRATFDAPAVERQFSSNLDLAAKLVDAAEYQLNDGSYFNARDVARQANDALQNARLMHRSLTLAYEAVHSAIGQALSAEAARARSSGRPAEVHAVVMKTQAAHGAADIQMAGPHGLGVEYEEVRKHLDDVFDRIREKMGQDRAQTGGVVVDGDASLALFYDVKFKDVVKNPKPKVLEAEMGVLRVRAEAPGDPKGEDTYKKLSLLIGATVNETEKPATGDNKRAALIGAGFRMSSKLGFTAGVAVDGDDYEPYVGVMASLSNLFN